MTNPITLQKTKAEARRVVESVDSGHCNPGADEGNCLYTNEYGEHCIAAQIAVNLGVPVPAYGEDENEKTCDTVDSFTAFEAPALNWIYAVQGKADQGYTWREAIKLATEEAWV